LMMFIQKFKVIVSINISTTQKKPKYEDLLSFSFFPNFTKIS
jgi:hypothetical protein